MGSTIDTMIKLLEESVDNDSGNVDVNDVFQRLTLDTIGKAVFHSNKRETIQPHIYVQDNVLWP